MSKKDENGTPGCTAPAKWTNLGSSEVSQDVDGVEHHGTLLCVDLIHQHDIKHASGIVTLHAGKKICDLYWADSKGRELVFHNMWSKKGTEGVLSHAMIASPLAHTAKDVLRKRSEFFGVSPSILS